MYLLSPAFPDSPPRPRGFTFVELAVVLVIISLLIGGLLMPLSAQRDMQQTTASSKLLATMNEALYGYAASHLATDGKPYLPCPDTDGDGSENRIGDDCASPEGDFPWADLGVGREDAWNNPIRYRVTLKFARRSAGFSLETKGDLRICETADCSKVIAREVPALLVSFGKNGGGTPTSADEVKNHALVAADKDFVQRPPVEGVFDDILVWLPSGILMHRMLMAGRLP